MKLAIIYLISLLCLTTSFIDTNNPRNVITTDDCKAILDSGNIFIQTSEFGLNTKPTINDPERSHRLDMWLRELPFKSLTCLLESDNISLKALGYLYAAMYQNDTLVNKYSYLLKDTTTIQLYMADGSVSPKIKLGQFLSIMSDKIKKDKDNLAKRPEIENIVSEFIKQYASYPNSYRPISFPRFSMGSDNEGGPVHFSIQHEYEIKNNQGKTETVISAFVLDKNLRINIIEKDSSSYLEAFPPKLEYWFKSFGRKLNKKDSVDLKLW